MSGILIKILFFFLLLLKLTKSGQDDLTTFTYDGFNMDGATSITSNGVLELTNATQYMTSHAFHPGPLRFKSAAGTVLSFSTTFRFSMNPNISGFGGNGLAFVISPTTDFSTAFPSQYLGLFNITNIGNPTNHIFAVELDTIQNPEFLDIDDNHIGIDINSLCSNKSVSAGYYDDSTGTYKNLTLISGKIMKVWIDFDGAVLRITLSPDGMTKPSRPLLSFPLDLSSVILDSMYVGFSSSTGLFHTSHSIYGWSFTQMPDAQLLNHVLPKERGNTKILVIWLPVALCLLVLTVVATVFIVWRRKKYADLLDDWELEYGPCWRERDFYRGS